MSKQFEFVQTDHKKYKVTKIKIIIFQTYTLMLITKKILFKCKILYNNKS